jgi:Family of unknown function (DUF5455)
MGALLGVLMGFLADIFGKLFLHASFKIAIALAFIAIFVAAVYAYLAGFSLVVTALGQTVPDIVSGVWGWVMPDNTTSCLFYLVSSTLIRFGTVAFFKVLDYKYRAAISN